MRARVDWMQYPGDDRILEFFQETDIILSPGIISANIELSRSHVSRRLSALADHGLIEATETGHGHYRITEKGRGYLSGELDESEI